MKKFLFCITITTMVLLLQSCATSSTTNVSFLCNNSDIEMYVNDTYVGKGLVKYTAPNGTTTADVVCKKNGEVVYATSIYIKGCNGRLFDIKVPERMSYSSQH